MYFTKSSPRVGIVSVNELVGNVPLVCCVLVTLTAALAFSLLSFSPFRHDLLWTASDEPIENSHSDQRKENFHKLPPYK